MLARHAEHPSTMLLTGTHSRTLDEKKRLALPKRVREQLGEPATLYVTPGPDQCLWLYTQVELERLADKLDRAPAKLVMLDAVAPLVRRFRAGRAWMVHRLAGLEVAADRYAIHHGASRAALARALIKMESLGVAQLGIGFASAADLRTRALLDPASEPTARSVPGWVAVMTLAIASICVLLVLFR